MKLHSDIVSDKVGLLANSARDEMNRDTDYVLKGLDKLFTSSSSLTKAQVGESSRMAEERVAKTAGKLKERIEKKRVDWRDQGTPIIKEASEGVDAALGKEYRELQVDVSAASSILTDRGQMVKIEGVNQKVHSVPFEN